MARKVRYAKLGSKSNMADPSEREALCAPHRVIYVNAGGAQPTFRRDRTSRTLVVVAMLGLAMCAALVMLGSNEEHGVNAAGKERGVVLSAARQQSLSDNLKLDDDAGDDKDGDDDDDSGSRDKDGDEDGKEKQDENDEDGDDDDDDDEDSAAKSSAMPSLASGDAEGAGADEPDTKDPDEGKDDAPPKDEKDDDADDKEETEEKVPPPPGCSTNAKDCLKTCLTQQSVEGDKVESLMASAKGYAECFINSCDDKQLPEGEKCKLNAREFDACWESLEALSADLMEKMERCTVQVSGEAKLKIDKYLDQYAKDFD